VALAGARALDLVGRRLDRALAGAEWLSLRAVWAGGALLFAAAFTVGVDVTIRKIWKLSIGGADELSGYAFAIATAWAFPYALLKRVNVRVDVAYQKLPRRAAALLDLFALLALVVLAAVLARYAGKVFGLSFQRESTSNSQLQVLLWIPQGLWFLGLALFFAVSALLTVRTAFAVLAGDDAAVQRLAGARTIQEEAREEAAYGQERAGGAGASGAGAAGGGGRP
jgi:TRAP-type C4-dicarboxylate transport system permease small subunit